MGNFNRPRAAIVGASTDRAKYGNKSVRAHINAGFEVFPVNPRGGEIEGLAAFKSLEDVPPGRLDRVSIYLPAGAAMAVLEQAARREVGQVWLNPGADDPEVVARAEALGLDVICGCSILDVGGDPGRL